MNNNLDKKHGTSDEYLDPFCDLCYETKNLNVKVYGYCNECVQFLCAGCHDFHMTLQGTKAHTVLRGADMPQSQAEKPPRYEQCHEHPKLLKTQFCLQHKLLLCIVCSFSDHSSCTVHSVEEVSEIIPNSEINSVNNAIKSLQGELYASVLYVHVEIERLKEEKKRTLAKIQLLYSKITSKLEQLYQDIQNKIKAKCQSYLSTLSHHEMLITNAMLRFKSSLTKCESFRGKTLDTKTFLQIQDSIGIINKCKNEIKDSEVQSPNVSFHILENKVHIKDLLSLDELVTIHIADMSRKHATKVVPDVLFPVSELSTPTTASPGHSLGQSTEQGATALSLRDFIQVSQSKPSKQATYNVKLQEDTEECTITGIAITVDKIILVDSGNNKIKLFTKEMQHLQSLLLRSLRESRLTDIAMTSDQEAVVTKGRLLNILNVSDTKLYTKNTHFMTWCFHGVTSYRRKLVFTCRTPSVMMMEPIEHMKWSVSEKENQRPKHPRYVCSHVDGRSSVIVTDTDNNMIRLLNVETGETITKRDLEDKIPYGVATDPACNVYVCYFKTREVAVLTGDLSEEKIILTKKNGLGKYPRAIAYDKETHRLLIAYDRTENPSGKRNLVDCFQL